MIWISILICRVHLNNHQTLTHSQAYEHRVFQTLRILNGGVNMINISHCDHKTTYVMLKACVKISITDTSGMYSKNSDYFWTAVCIAI